MKTYNFFKELLDFLAGIGGEKRLAPVRVPVKNR